MSTVQEFSTLNGYKVKDATARQQISELNTEVGGKVAKDSIANNLTTDDATKVLSAKQGKELAKLISDLEEDLGERIDDAADGKSFVLTEASKYIDFVEAAGHAEFPNTMVTYNAYPDCRYIGRPNLREGFADGFRFFSAGDREFVTAWFTSDSNNDATPAEVEVEPVIKPVAVFYNDTDESLSIGE